MATKKTKSPKVGVVTPCVILGGDDADPFRVIQVRIPTKPQTFEYAVESQDGKDALGVRRWRAWTHEDEAAEAKKDPYDSAPLSFFDWIGREIAKLKGLTT